MLIESALEQVDELLVVIYACDELPQCPLPIRAQWIRQLYPQVTVLEAADGPKETGYSQTIIDKQNRFLQHFLRHHSIDVFFSSEEYGAHVSDALQCRDVRVDMSRAQVPISATKLRNNPSLLNQFVDPLVLNNMNKKIVFLGAPSTGKSTLCEALSERLNTVWVPEYGRDYWLEHQVDRRLTPEQLLHIAQVQNQWEEEYNLRANQWLLCDTNAFTTWHFALHYHQRALPALEQLARDSWQRYALIVLCDNDIPYDDTWERSGDANRQEFQTFLQDYMAQHRIEHLVAKGNLEQRVEQVLAAMATL